MILLQGCVEGLTDLINEEETLLYLSTLDGTFIGVNHKNGDVLWQFKEGNVYVLTSCPTDINDELINNSVCHHFRSGRKSPKK